MASRLHDPSLMESQCTEAASAKASTVADQTEFDFLRLPERRPSFFIRRMIGSHIRQCVDRRPSHLVRQRLVPVDSAPHSRCSVYGSTSRFPGKWIGIAVLGIKTACIRPAYPGIQISSKDGSMMRIVNAVQIFRFVNSSSQYNVISFITDTAVQIPLPSQRYVRSPIPYRYKVCTGIQQNGTFDFVWTSNHNVPRRRRLASSPTDDRSACVYKSDGSGYNTRPWRSPGVFPSRRPA